MSPQQQRPMSPRAKAVVDDVERRLIDAGILKLCDDPQCGPNGCGRIATTDFTIVAAAMLLELYAPYAQARAARPTASMHDVAIGLAFIEVHEEMHDLADAHMNRTN